MKHHCHAGKYMLWHVGTFGDLTDEEAAAESEAVAWEEWVIVSDREEGSALGDVALRNVGVWFRGLSGHQQVEMPHLLWLLDEGGAA